MPAFTRLTRIAGLAAITLALGSPVVGFAKDRTPKTIIDLPAKSSALSPGQQLQDAVNNIANVGKILRLAPGTYVLSPTRPDGMPNPAAGRLILQSDMEITGANQYTDCDADGIWDPTNDCALITSGNWPASETVSAYVEAKYATVIDGRAINAIEPALAAPAPILGPQRPTAVLRIGRNNTVSRITVLAPANANVAGAIDINVLPETGGMNATITDTVVSGGQRGIRMNNGPAARNGINSYARLERNIVHDSKLVLTTTNPFGFGMGIQVQNGFTTGSRWDVIITDNRVVQNPTGIFAVANSATHAENSVLADHNLLLRNGAGYVLLGGFDGPQGAGTGNELDFTSKRDRFVLNQGSPFLDQGGAVLAIGGANDQVIPPGATTPVAPSSNNFVRLRLIDPTFIGNTRLDGSAQNLSVYGYLSRRDRSANGGSGSGNGVALLLRRAEGTEAAGSFVFKHNLVHLNMTPDSTNAVSLIGSDVALEAANPILNESPDIGLEP